jgi:hypothetical protein
MEYSKVFHLFLPSFKRVISMSIMTGMWKKDGQSIESGFSVGWYSYGLNAKTAIKKKIRSCRVADILYVMKFLILTNIQREIRIPWMIVERPSSVRIISAAARAASVDPVCVVWYVVCECAVF